MVLSMTGYGAATAELEHVRIAADVRALNSRYLDLTLRLPRALQAYEAEVRQRVAQRLERGKVTVTIELQKVEEGSSTVLDYGRVAGLYEAFKRAAEATGAPQEGLFLK
ncbi:MAG: YicC/YloC family endoribonuclease, partial [Catalinimonas sp.]